MALPVRGAVLYRDRVDALVSLRVRPLVTKKPLTRTDTEDMNAKASRTRNCALCDTRAEYLTPFGMLCHPHSDQLVESDTSWFPIPIQTGVHVTPGLRRRLKG